MKITWTGSHFVAQARYEDRELLKKAGFEWRADHKAWATSSPLVASRLRKFTDGEAKDKINSSLISVTPWTGRILFPETCRPKPFQIAATKFALERNHSYIAADPGLGKTIMAAMLINTLGKLEQRNFIVVNQPSLCLNTKAEFDKWCYSSVKVDIFDGVKKIKPSRIYPSVVIVPDTRLSDELGFLADTVAPYNDLGDAVLIVDEAQRFSNDESQRTKALLRLCERFEKIVFLSGTPLRNRPIELFAILSRFNGESISFRNRSQYGQYFCAGYFDSYGRANYNGASRTEELFENVKKKFMLRLRKADVLPELPPKTEEIVFLAGGDTPAEIIGYERKHLKALSPEDLTRPKVTQSPFLATYRRLLGEYKVPAAISFIREILETGDENILIFAEHVATVALLEKGLKEYKPITITGAVSAREKQWRVDFFQKNKCRVFIGNTQACGTGFTLTKATRVIHVEPSWVPADSDQASDRAHRIGQKSPVFIQYLCFKNSLDRAVLETAIRKRETIQNL